MHTYIYNNSYTVNVNMHIIISIYIYMHTYLRLYVVANFTKVIYIYIKIDK